MKQIIQILLFVIMIGISNTAISKTSGSIDFYSTTPEVVKRFSFLGTVKYSFNKNWAFKGVSLVNSSFAEGIIGPVYSPFKWLALGYSVGISQDKGKLAFRNHFNLYCGIKWIYFFGMYLLSSIVPLTIPFIISALKAF